MSTPITNSVFKTLDFEDAVRELENPQIDDWEFFTESHDVKIYRLYNEDSGLYQYKIYGYMRDVSPKTCAKVYMDLEYRRVWDTYVKKLEEVDVNGKKLIYWNINYPFPLWNRDYVFSRELRELKCNNQNVWVVLARTEIESSLPEIDGVVRVDDYIQSAALMTDDNNGTKAFMKYYDNPRGAIPTWLINWAAKTGVPQFLTIMETACKGYDAYLQEQSNQSS